MLTRSKIDLILESNGFDAENYRTYKILYSDYPEINPLDKEDAESNVIFYVNNMLPIYDCGWNADNAYKFIEEYKSSINPQRKRVGYYAHNAHISRINRAFYLSQGIINKPQTIEEKIIAIFNHRAMIGHFRDTKISLKRNDDGLFTITYIDINGRNWSYTYPLIKIYSQMLFFKNQ